MQLRPRWRVRTRSPVGITQLSQRVWEANGTVTITTPPTIEPAICAEALANLTTHRTALNATMLGCAAAQDCSR